MAPPEGLLTLERWFEELWPAAEKYGGVLPECAAMARQLLVQQQEICVLHGDLHHENILHLPRGWLAIDPKRLTGDRAFDFANIFCNPDKATALSEGRLAKQLQVVADTTGIDTNRLLRWIIAWAGLSAARILNEPNEGGDVSIDLGVAAIALQLYTK